MLDKKSLKQNKGFKIQLKKRLLKSFCKDNVGEYGRIRQLSKDNRGNYSIIISAILIISFLILSIAFFLSSGVSEPLIVTASTMFFFSKLSI